MLAAAGITVNRGSLSQWANRAIALLKPIHEAQWRSVLESAVIQMDETPIRAGRHPGKPGSMKKGFFWPVLGDRGEVVFPFSNSRQHRHAAEFLGDYAGTLVSDGYGAYEAYAEARNGAVRHQNCRVGGVVTEPLPSQTRTSRFPASGSSHVSFAHGGVQFMNEPGWRQWVPSKDCLHLVPGEPPLLAAA